jgi:SAM-dependent methyltransferase
MVDWMNVSSLSFNAILLMERVQLSWLPGWVPEPEFAIALQANPVVEWYLRHKCPELDDWLDGVMAGEPERPTSPRAVRRAEKAILRTINELVVYTVDPAVYDAQPFLTWDSSELTGLVDFTDKVVIDVGAGTGRLTMVAAQEAAMVYGVEPVANLRRYLKKKVYNAGLENVFVVDGLITDIPYPRCFADVTMGGYVFGEEPEAEYRELLRVTRKGGTVLLFPGNEDWDNEQHWFLVDKGFEWSRFETPQDGIRRAYWCTVA